MCRLRALILLGVTAALVAGCANDPPPREQLQLSERVIAQARQLGAEAPLIDGAETRLQAAREAFASGAHRQARRLAEQAELDARLAEAQALTQRGRQHLDELRVQIERLLLQIKEQP